MSDRPASHPDDLNASLADRLLLALGIWPHHAEQVGYAEVVEAAVIIRTQAHREPMIAEDWATERALREELEAIVRDLAASGAAQNVAGFCHYCDENIRDGGRHAESCPWRRARELTGDSE